MFPAQNSLDILGPVQGAVWLVFGVAVLAGIGYRWLHRRMRAEIARRDALISDLCTARDAAEALSQAKSNFIATISHELRTPLNSIIGFSEMIDHEMFGPVGNVHYKEYVGDILDSGRHLLHVINDLLDLSKIEANRFELQEQKVDLAAIVASALRLVQVSASRKSLLLETRYAPDVPVLRGDERVIRQMVLNLLSNAVKFTPGGGRIDVQVACHEDGDILLMVSDTGIGIAPQDIARVLEPFGQLNSHLHLETKGTGLGLPLTRALAQLHGASLGLQSAPGVGTTVTIRFPIWRVVDQDRAPV